jgi:hypothetical protein
MSSTLWPSAIRRFGGKVRKACGKALTALAQPLHKQPSRQDLTAVAQVARVSDRDAHDTPAPVIGGSRATAILVGVATLLLGAGCAGTAKQISKGTQTTSLSARAASSRTTATAPVTTSSSQTTATQSSTSSAARVSKSQYTSDAEKICRSADARTSVLLPQLATQAALYAAGGLSASATRKVGPAATSLQSALASMLGDLQGLTRPSAEDAELQVFLGSTSALVSASKLAARYFRAGNAMSAVNSVGDMVNAEVQAQAAAKAYGLAACAAAVLPAGV